MFQVQSAISDISKYVWYLGYGSHRYSKATSQFFDSSCRRRFLSCNISHYLRFIIVHFPVITSIWTL